jgi:hypothetical protein
MMIIIYDHMFKVQATDFNLFINRTDIERENNSLLF